MTFLYVLLIAAQSFDVGTTALKLREGGCHEAGWPSQHAWVIGGVKGAAVGGTIMLGRSGRKKTALALSMLGIVSGTIGGIHNMGVNCHG